MGEYTTNTEITTHYQSGALRDVRIRHHHGTEGIDDTSPAIPRALWVSMKGASNAHEVLALSTSGPAFHHWLSASERGIAWVRSELLPVL